jgi:hypothetical protein
MKENNRDLTYKKDPNQNQSKLAYNTKIGTNKILIRNLSLILNTIPNNQILKLLNSNRPLIIYLTKSNPNNQNNNNSHIKNPNNPHRNKVLVPHLTDP